MAATTHLDFIRRDDEVRRGRGGGGGRGRSRCSRHRTLVREIRRIRLVHYVGTTHRRVLP